jgi:hypothetical protein
LQDYYTGSGEETKVTSYGRRKRRSFVERHGRSFEKPKTGNELLVTQAFVVVDKFNKSPGAAKKTPASQPIRKLPVAPAASVPTFPQNLYSPRPTNDISFGQDTSRSPLKPTIQSEAVAAEEESAEICLNAVGIVVGVCMFLVAQLIIVFGVAHFWQKRRNKLKAQSEESLQNMFNPYSVRR